MTVYVIVQLKMTDAKGRLRIAINTADIGQKTDGNSIGVEATAIGAAATPVIARRAFAFRHEPVKADCQKHNTRQRPLAMTS